MGVLSAVGDSLWEAFFMFWETLWALVLGFGLSGAVQAFVSRAQMQRALGDHRPGTIAKAGFFGAISSSCSYAAAALAKTLFGRGADFTAAQAFMFASTNLVVELGIVLWLLLGWQFALAEFVGGAIMIALLALVLPRVVPRGGRATPRPAGPPRRHDGADAHGGSRDGRTSRRRPMRERIRSLAGWSDAAGYTISDLTMLRKELVIGFVVAGFAEAAVPDAGLAVAVPHRPRLLVGRWRTCSSGRSWRSSASSARSATCRWRRRCGTAASPSAARSRSSSPT